MEAFFWGCFWAFVIIGTPIFMVRLVIWLKKLSFMLRVRRLHNAKHEKANWLPMITMFDIFKEF